MIQSFMAAGMGIAVIPGLGVAHPAPQVQVRQLAHETASRRVWVASLPDLYPSPATRGMIDLLVAMTRHRRTR